MMNVRCIVTVAVASALLLAGIAFQLNSPDTNAVRNSGSAVLKAAPHFLIGSGMNSVLIYFQNGSYYWYFAQHGRYNSGFNLTVASVGYYGMAFNYTNYSFGTFINMIGGVWNNNTTFNPSWALWIWNSSLDQWSVSPVGIGDISMSGTLSIALSYSYWTANFSAPLYTPPPTPADPYPVYQARAVSAGTGDSGPHSNLPLLPPTPGQAWTAGINVSAFGGTDSQPIEYNGLVYVLTDGPSSGGKAGIFAFNYYGDQVWNNTLGSSGYELSSPLAADGMLIVASTNGYLYAFNAADGHLVYRINLHSATGITSSPVLGPQGYFVLNDTGGVFYFSFNGTEYWNYTIGTPSYYSSPSFSDGILYVASNLNGSGRVTALIVPNASARPHVLWQRGLSGLVYDTPSVYGGKVYLTQARKSAGAGTSTYGSVELTVLNAVTGFFVANYSAGVSDAFPSSVLATGHQAIFSDGSELLSVNTSASNSTSYILWKMNLNNEYGSPSPFAFDRYIMVSEDASNASVFVLSDNGLPIWNFTDAISSSYSLSSPSYNGTAMVWGNDAGQVFSFEHLQIANFTYSQVNGTVTLRAEVIQGASPVLNYTWNYGSGQYSYSQVTEHTYTANGTYPVTLKVVYSENTTAYYSGQVTVNSVVHVAKTVAPAKKQSFPVTYLYLAAGIVVLVIAASAAYAVINRRKRKEK
jgi:hypothetical protein